MTLVVGAAPEHGGKAALHLAAELARSAGEDVVVASVVPAPWYPSLARVDAEYQSYLVEAADRALAGARAALPSDVPVTTVVQHASSAAEGLLEVADVHDASLVVVGSSSAGVFGHVALGSVSDRLVHSSARPVALAPRGFRARADGRVRRVTAAYGGSEAADDLVIAAARVAGRVGATLRLASFAVRPPSPITAGIGSRGEEPVVQEWIAAIHGHAEDVLADVRRLPEPPLLAASVVGWGPSWQQAIEDVTWDEGDVLVVGSSSSGAIARVFIGSNATKIVRHSPVPVVVVPRDVAAGDVDEVDVTG